jgi:hypothetical protein
MGEPDLELEGWQRHWQSQDTVPADLAQRVAAGTRSLQRGRIAEILTTIVMCGATAVWALVSRRADVIVLAVGVWLLVAIAWAASTMLRRGISQPVTSTTSAFVEISILRCERSLHAITFQAAFYVVIVGFDLVWLYYYRAESSVQELLMRPPVIGVLTIVTPVLAAAAIWYRRRLQRELKNLISLRLTMSRDHGSL